MTSMTASTQVSDSQKTLINVLVLSSDGLRRDLLESGISNAPSVALVQSDDLWERDSLKDLKISTELNVVVIDMSQFDSVERGLEIGHELKAMFNNPAIVVLAGSNEILAETRKQMFEVGPKWSFLTTNLITGLDDLVRIIDSAASGMTIVDPGFFADTQTGSGREAYLTRPLTARQVQVLELVSAGYNNEVVANKLEISLRTVEHHLNEAYVSIKNCRSSEINARVYASKVFSECLT